MSFNAGFTQADPMRPMLNIGEPFDHFTGRYYPGMRGEMVLNGGLDHLTGFAGRGNMFKTVLMNSMMYIALERYLNAEGQLYDCELTASLARQEQICQHIAPSLSDEGLEGHPRFAFTTTQHYSGNEWFDKVKASNKERRKDLKTMRDTPFTRRDGSIIKAYDPALLVVDSLTEFEVDQSQEMVENNSIGDSKTNTEAMKGGGAKAQMIGLIPGIAAQSGAYFLMSAHIADNIQMDKYNPIQKKLAFLKGDIKLSRVPGRFTYRSNVLYLVDKLTVMLHDKTKLPEYPRDASDDLVGSTDLIELTIMNVRCKSGPTGLPFKVIVSQSEGLLPGLTAFNLIKGFERYGLGGSLQNYYMEFLPEVKLMRTTVRQKITQNAKLRRAIELTCGLCIMQNISNVAPELACTPKELYDDLAKRYDWNILLETRGYWTFDQYTNPIPFLSCMDLLNMRAGTYHPYWYDEAVKNVHKS